jgi:hypothetical protein
VRHLDQVKLKEVRERFKDSVLPEEKAAIAFIRTQQQISKPIATKTENPKEATTKEAADLAAFAENLAQQRIKRQQRPKGPRVR